MSSALSNLCTAFEDTDLLQYPTPMTDILKVCPGGTVNCSFSIEQLYIPFSQKQS